MTLGDLGNLLRAVGLNPSQKMIYEIMQWLDEKGFNKLTFDEFKSLLARLWYEANYAQELRDAFDAFDSLGNGYFTLEQMKSVLLGMGEKLDEQDFKEICKVITVKADNTINFEGISISSILFYCLQKSRKSFSYYYEFISDIIKVLSIQHKPTTKAKSKAK